MAIPVVAIIGRPNVGKSSLLNALAGEMISIVESTPGVTRDRVTAVIETADKYFELVDTGGYGIVDSDQLNEHVEEQIQKAMASAELVLFMVDIRTGLTPLDERIGKLLHQKGLDVIGVANKADTHKQFAGAGEFSRMGFGDFLCISVANNINKSVLLEEIGRRLAHIKSEKPDEPVMKIAIVGKRNAGKSTFLNSMAGAYRVIVSEKPGTTRDAVDVRFEKDGRTIVAIDTAGVRKKGKMNGSIEFYSYVRTVRSVHRADVVFFLIDATLPVSQVDKKLAKLIAEEYRSCILVVNKWDLAKDIAVTEDYEQYLTKSMPGLKYAPIVFTTATESKNVQSAVDLAAEIFKQATTRIPTARLNKAFEVIKSERIGTKKTGRTGRPKIYYATQPAVNPITIVMFVNNAGLFDENYRRFIVNRLSDLLGLEEVPIKLLIRSHRK